jgi:hypothetical protein
MRFKTALRVFFIISLRFIFIIPLYAEEFRVQPGGVLEVSQEETAAVSLPYNGSALIYLGEDWRFFRGIELELSAPAEWLSHRGSLAAAAYADLEPRQAARFTPGEILDLSGTRFYYEPLPGKLQTVYQIPLYEGHGMRSGPYALVPPGHVAPPSFPILFRLSPAIKGIGEELERMSFRLSVKPILGDRGAVRLHFRYPQQLPDKPFTLLIDDQVIDRPLEELLLKEGEHHLLVLSDDYRNESRLFLVERAKVLELNIELQDPAPLLIFEGPEGAVVFLDNEAVEGTDPVPVEPGTHEVRFQVSDYSISRTIRVQRGKTYRIAMTVDVDIAESD